MKILTPFNVKRVLFQRHYPGYLYRREIVDDSDHGGDGKLEMVNCYDSKTGAWIGDARMTRFLCKTKGLRQIQKSQESHCVASIGFNAAEQRWYGWSHRAICGFGIGDKMFDEAFGDDDTPYTEHGTVPIHTIEEARASAVKFAKSVS